MHRSLLTPPYFYHIYRGALLSLTPGGLGCALSPALMSNSTLATIQGTYPNSVLLILAKHLHVGMGNIRHTLYFHKITMLKRYRHCVVAYSFFYNVDNSD